MTDKLKNDVIGKKVKITKPTPPKTDIDLDNSLEDAILEAADTSTLKTDVLNSFSTLAQNREAEFELIDTMGMDSTIAAAIETYTEDIVQPNDKGQIFWIESDDKEVAKYTSYLMQKINFDKNAYKWAYDLVKYGDVYVKLVRKSEFENSIIFNSNKKDSLQEDVNLVMSSKNDHYADVLDTVNNPNEMFELTKFGKTIGFIQAPVNVQKDFRANNEINSYITYNMRKRDVNIYSATDYIHACMEDSVSRTTEEIDIFLDDDSDGEAIDKKSSSETFQVKRGAGILNDLFKVWRQLSLMENSILLSRITRASITRVIQCEIGDMPKNQVQNVITRIKALLEQKSSIDVNNKMSEYVNPGPVENMVIVPTRNGKGGLSTQQIGGDYDPKTLTDLDWFNNKLFGGLKIPKQYLGWTDDNTGFNGGTSLTILSSRYGKAIKRFQKCLIEMVTNALNLILIDKGYSRMVNKFRVVMQSPLTQEDLDLKQDLSNSLRNVSDIMNTLSDIQEPQQRLKILKGLLSDVLANQEITNVLQEEIEKLEKEAEGQTNKNQNENQENDLGGGFEGLDNTPSPIGEEPLPETPSQETSLKDNIEEQEQEFNPTDALEQEEETTETQSENNPQEINNETNNEERLPSFSELGIDGTDNRNNRR